MRRSLLVVPLALLLLLVPSGSAVAATVRLDDRTGDVVYRTAPGERNDLRIRATDEPVRGHEFVELFFVDSVPIDASGECRPAGGGPSTYLREVRA